MVLLFYGTLLSGIFQDFRNGRVFVFDDTVKLFHYVKPKVFLFCTYGFGIFKA